MGIEETETMAAVEAAVKIGPSTEEALEPESGLAAVHDEGSRIELSHKGEFQVAKWKKRFGNTVHESNIRTVIKLFGDDYFEFPIVRRKQGGSADVAECAVVAE